MSMQMLRAVLFNILFYAVMAIYMLAILPLLLLPRPVVTKAMLGMAHLLVWLQALFGTRVEVRGRENIPQGGFLIAAKHQSMWETQMLPRLFVDPAFIYKQELDRVPLFGLYMRKFDMVPIDREKGAKTLREMTRCAREKIAQGRQLIIFPEGTRRAPGSPPDYKTGVALLYAATDALVLPVALNSGVFWSNYFWRGRSGTIVIDILPPIPPGMPKQAFLAELQMRLEAASTALFA